MKLKLLILSLLCYTTTQAQSPSNAAWEKFFQNDRITARKLFTQLAAKPVTADEANIALSMMTDMDRPISEGFTYLDKLYKTSKNPQPYLFALWGDPSNYYNRLKSPEQLAFYKSLSERTDLDGTLPAMAVSLLGAHYESSKQLDLAKQSYGKLGELEDWLITGEYENISTSGFDKKYDVLDHPELSYNFVGKKGRQFNWRTVPYTRHDKWFDFTYYNNYKNALQFAQTFVNAPADITGQIRVGVSGSVKVWVNDQLVINEAEERNNDLDSYISSIKLNSGINRILVQIGESYADRSNFLIRLTDNSGRPLKDITTSSTPQPYKKETSFTPTPAKPYAFNYFETELKAKPNSYLNQLMLAKLYLRQGNLYEARNLLEDLKEKFPKSTYLNLQFIQLFAKSDNRTGMESVREDIRLNDPECSLALELAYNEHMEQNDYVNAQLVLDNIEKIFGEDEEVLSKKITIASKQKNQQEVVAIVERAYPKFPNSQDIVDLKYVIETQINKNPQALPILEKYLAANSDYKAAKYLAKIHFEKGETDAGLELYKDELKNDPVAFGIYNDLGDQYYRLQQFDKAEQIYRESMKIDPNNAPTYTALGQIYEAAKQKDKSIAAYQKSLQIDPNNYDAIQSLRRLEGKKTVFDYFTQPDVKALIASAPKATDFPDDHVVTLDNEVQKVVYENGGSEEKHIYLAKVLTQKGLESLKEYSIPVNSDQSYNIEVAEVLKANGTKVPAERNRTDLVFTNLEVGDAINIRYKIENYFVGTMSTHFWDSFYFNDGLPNMNTKYSLLIHKDKPFKYVFSEKEIAPVKTKKDEFDLYVWQQTNQNALRYEDKMPPMDDVTNKLYVSTIPDWQFIANWYNDIAAAKARSSYEIKAVTKALFAGKPNLDQLTKVKMIYKYITENIAYSSVSFRQSGIVPQNPATVINTRIGDCKDVSTLFVTMCKEAGIKAELALVSTRENGQNTLLLPSMEFNHCIAKATVDNKDYWVELTSGTLPFNTFDNTFINSNVLPINSSSNVLTKFNPELRGRNNLSYTTTVSIKDADMMVKESNWNTGSMASYLRGAFKDISNKDQIKKMKEQLSGAFPENEIYSLDISNLGNQRTSDTVTTATSYKLINVCKPVAGMSIFSIPWSNKSSATSLQVVLPRKFGLDLTQLFYSDASNQTVTLELPAGKTVVAPFKDVKLSNDFAEFALESTTKDNKLILKRSFVLKKDFVPLDKVAAFKDFYKQMAEADDQQLAMKL